MILIIAPASCGAECARTLQKITGRDVQAISDLRLASRLLNNSEFSVIVIDQNLAEAEPAGCESLLNRAGSAVPVFVNFAVSGINSRCA